MSAGERYRLSVMTATAARKRRLEWRPYLYMLPALLIFGAVLLYPLLYSFYLSFHDWTMQTFRQGVPFIALEHYAAAFADARFWNALRVTLTFMGLALTFEFILGMVLALLLDRLTIGKTALRALMLLPLMCTNIVIGLMWRMLYNYDFGTLNYFLSTLGIRPVAWLSEVQTALFSLVAVDVWNTTCFVALILLAGLQTQSTEIHESAQIDGASSVQRFRYVTLPLLRPALMVALLWRTIDTFRIFDVVFSLTAGGPAQTTETISLYIYRNGFQQFDLGYTAALSMIMIVILFVFAFALYRLIGRLAVAH
jgi:multiple sugar transport system permease protein